MKIESVTLLVNTMVNEKKFSRARDLIVQEWKRLTEGKNYQLLNDNAKQLVKIINAEKETATFNTLTLKEKNILNIMNQYIRDLHLSLAKKIYIEHITLFEKEEAQKLLTSDAKFICKAWKESL